MFSKRMLIAIVLFAILSAGCRAAPQPAVSPQAQSPASSSAPSQAAPAAPSLASPPEATPTLQQADPSWALVQDQVTGAGFAVPCWWQVAFPGAEGIARTISVANYDQAYFEANSERGVWTGGVPPQGAVKFDLTLITLEDPALSDEQSARLWLENDLQTIDSLQPATLGRHPALEAQLRSSVNGELSTVYALRAAPDLLVLFAVYPTAGLAADDIQLVLASLALSADQEIILPGIPADAPLPGVDPFCKL